MNNRLTRRFCVLAAVSALSLVSGVLTLAASVPARAAAASFPLRNYNNFSRCLGISGGRHDAPAILWDCNGHPDQQWRFGVSVHYNGLTWYQLINSDNQCLGVLGSSISQGAKVVGWDCTGNTDQYWWEDTHFTICGGFHPFFNLNAVVKSNFYVFGVSGNKTSEDAPILLWEFQGIQRGCNNQEWAG